MRTAAWIGLALVVATTSARAQDTTRALEKAYREARDDDTRRRAIKALGEETTTDSERVLADALASDPSEAVRMEAVTALLKKGDEPAARALLQAVNSYDPYVTEAVVAGLAKAMPEKFHKWVADAGLAHERPEIRAASVRIMGAAHPAELGPKLGKLSVDAAPEVREAVALSVGKLDQKQGLALADRFLHDLDLRVRVAAITALGSIEGDKAEKLLAVSADKDASWQARVEAIHGLSERAAKRHLDVFLHALRDVKADRRVRLAALDGVAPLKETSVVDALVALASDGPDRLEVEIRKTLSALTGQEIATGAEWRAWWRGNKGGFQFPAEPSRAATPGLATRAKFFDLPVESLRPCFVLDISGSMSEPMPVASGTTASAASQVFSTKIAVARAELKRCLEALPKEAAFGVILFADRTVPIQDKPVPARPDTIAAALAQVDAYSPSGSTNLYGAFSNVLHGSSPRDPAAAEKVEFDSIYLLTDGLPTSGAVIDSGELRARVRDFNRFARVRIHTIGIGEENRDLLLGLATDSGGRCVQR
jgi:HEAT repeat protein